jgi:hypothetical protein
VETLSRHLNAGRSLWEQQRELRSKCSEMEKAGEKTILVIISCGENLALFIFSTEMFKL